MFSAPMINLYSRDLAKTQAFYERLGFTESFRTPATGAPIHVELRLDGFTIGIATVETAMRDHGLSPGGEGRWIEVVVWAEDADEAVRRLTAAGAPLLSPPHDWLDGRLRLAWVADPDGNPIQIAQRQARR
jgi:catechol 2,3-dioxygenase-like lactoylglutathione lyase family enzyme